MKKLVVLLVSAAALAWAQCPTGTSYPSAVDTGATLTVAANNLSTTLLSDMLATDTVAVVVDPSGWTANMMATIDAGANTEMVYVTAVSGNVLTISRACEVPGGGYSATALAHAAGVPVVENATAYSGHASVVGALEAIENALGPNLSHVSASGPIMSASSYNFPAYSCSSSLVCAPGGPSGGALIAGNNTLTFTPIPNGVNGTDTNHKLSVSGGTGTAEACLITGGSGTSGETNGQIILQCAYSHSGAFTIQSATNGGQEAMEILKTAGTGGEIRYPPGVLSNCGTLTVDTDGIVISGAGSAAAGPLTSGSGAAGTIIQPCFANQTLFSASGHAYTGSAPTSTVARLSMHDLAVQNNGLAGITAIGLLRDANGIFTNLSFYGTTSSMWGIYGDRVEGTQVSNIKAVGLASSFFGSSTDTDSVTGQPYSFLVDVASYFYAGTGYPTAALVIQRCVQCTVDRAHMDDEAATGTGTGIQVLNNTQGLTIASVSMQGYGTGIQLASNTVGSTTAAPGWTTISNAQIDCGVEATSTPGTCGYTGGSGPTHIQIGQGAYLVSIVNPTLTGSWAPNGLISVAGNTAEAPSVQLTGGLVQPSDGNGIYFTSSDSYPVESASITGTIIQASTGSYVPIVISGAASIPNFVFTGNTLLAGTAGPFAFLSGGAIANGYLFGNECSSDTNNYCNGGALGTSINWTGLAGGVHPATRVSVNNLPILDEYQGSATPTVVGLDGGVNGPTTNSFTGAMIGVLGTAVENNYGNGSGEAAAVGVFGAGYIGAQAPSSYSTSAWGANFVTNNCVTTDGSCSNGQGYSNNNNYGVEIDTNVFKDASGNSAGNERGLLLTGGSSHIPAGLANAMEVAQLGIFSGIAWKYGLEIDDAAANAGGSYAGILIGANSTSGPAGCMPIQMHSLSAGDTSYLSVVTCDQYGDLILIAGQAGVALEDPDRNIGLQLVTSGSTPYISIPNELTMGTAGTLLIPAQKSISGQRYVCITTTGELVSSASACSGT
jgi:hypothetical protein